MNRVCVRVWKSDDVRGQDRYPLLHLGNMDHNLYVNKTSHFLGKPLGGGGNPPTKRGPEINLENSL